MHSSPRPSLLAFIATAGAVSGLGAQTLTKELVYTRFDGGTNVRQVTFTYDAGLGTATFSNYRTIASTPGADGVMFAPDGDLIVGGQGDAVHKVVTSTGGYTTVNVGGVASFHVMLDPRGQTAWTAAIPGFLASVPLAPFANGTPHAINGDDTEVTHVTFSNGQAFYTSSQASGLGHFGRIDMNTFTTTRIHANVPWAHGMTRDCYTGHLIVYANAFMAQIDPVTTSVVSTLDATPALIQLDQGTSDGDGHLYIASNSGHMLFLDITVSHAIGSADFVGLPFLEAFADDIAPDCGLGARPTGAHTIGYWKTHPEAWPVTDLQLGCQSYTKAECITLLQRPVRGDASLNLAHQLIATKLNIIVGAFNWPSILPVTEQADALLCGYTGRLPYGVPSGSPAGSQLIVLAGQLDNFNNGIITLAPTLPVRHR